MRNSIKTDKHPARKLAPVPCDSPPSHHAPPALALPTIPGPWPGSGRLRRRRISHRLSLIPAWRSFPTPGSQESGADGRSGGCKPQRFLRGPHAEESRVPIPYLPFRRPARAPMALTPVEPRSEEHTSELQSPCNLVCRLLLEKK